MVVVDLPFEPVIQYSFASVYCAANSISEITGMPACFNVFIKGAWLGMPGLLTTKAACMILCSVCCCSSKSISSSCKALRYPSPIRSEEHTSELQSRENLVCRLLLEKKK